MIPPGPLAFAALAVRRAAGVPLIPDVGSTSGRCAAMGVDGLAEEPWNVAVVSAGG